MICLVRVTDEKNVVFLACTFSRFKIFFKKKSAKPTLTQGLLLPHFIMLRGRFKMKTQFERHAYDYCKIGSVNSNDTFYRSFLHKI